MRILMLLGCLALCPVVGQDLGTFGATFPIQEQSLLAIIYQKLQGFQESGLLITHQQAIQAKVKEAIYRPVPVKGLRTTINPRQFLFNPSITIPQDIKDHEGRVIQVRAVINPLETVSLSKALLFINGEDSSQVNWALKQYEVAKIKPKLILVQGSPLALMEQHELPFYFDQSGIISKKLGLTQIPSRVTQQGLYLLVEEVKV